MRGVDPKKINQFGQASTAGVMLAACIFVGLGIGISMDRWLNTKPWFTILLMLLGIIAGFYNVIRTFIKPGKPKPLK